MTGGPVPEQDLSISASKLERALGELRGVRGARVDVNGTDVKAIRVLVVPERQRNRTTVEVQRLAAVTLGIEVDPTRVQVLSALDAAAEGDLRRRKLSSITLERTGDRFSARITLDLGGDVLVGEAEGSAINRLEHRTVARATLDGLRDLLDFSADVEAIDFLQVGEVEIVMVALSKSDGYLAGSAVVRHDVYEAIVKATLDALNRFTTRQDE